MYRYWQWESHVRPIPKLLLLLSLLTGLQAPAFCSSKIIPLHTISSPDHLNRTFSQLQNSAIHTKFHRLFILDRSNHHIRLLSQHTLAPALVIGDKRLRFPQDLTIPPDGFLLVADGKQGNILKWNLNPHFPAYTKTVHFDQTINAIASLSKDEYLILDKYRNKLTLIKNDRPIWKISGFGSGVSEFKQPTDIAVFNKTIYIADPGNHRVSAFNERLKPLFTINADPKHPFIKPSTITTDEKGFLYIADEARHTVYIFDGQHQFVRSINHLPNARQKNLYRPTGLSAQEGKLWINTPNGIYVFQLTHWHNEWLLAVHFLFRFSDT